MGSFGSLVPTLGFIPMLYVNFAPFGDFLLFTQRMQGPFPSLYSGNGKYTLIVSRRLSIDVTSFTGKAECRSTHAHGISKVPSAECETILMLSRVQWC